MELRRVKGTTEKLSGDKRGIRDAMSVKAEPAAASSLSSLERVPRSIGETTDNMDYSNGKNYPKSLVNICGKLESGSGSGQDGGQHEDGTDIAAKKRRTRRGKPKHRKLKPYSKQQLSYQQQLRSRCMGGIRKTGRQPPAPYNTTQFLMADHNDLPALEQKLQLKSEVAPMVSRTRDSSFSFDSDEDYFYSSPENEEEFLTKEFSTAYEDLHAERLNTLTKSELIQEYIQLEAKVDLLTKRLRNKNLHQIEERDSENKNVSDSETAKKLKLCQQRIDDLLQQNEQLRRDNEMLRTKKLLRATQNNSETSVDSESDSNSSSSSNQSRCSCSPGTSPKNAYKSKIDNSLKMGSKNDSCNTSQSGSPQTSISIPTNLFKNHATNETDTFSP